MVQDIYTLMVEESGDGSPSITVLKVGGEDWRIHTIHGNNAELVIDILNRKESKDERISN